MRTFRQSWFLLMLLLCAGWAQAQSVNTISGAAAVEAKQKKGKTKPGKPKKAAAVVGTAAVAGSAAALATMPPVAADFPSELQTIADQIHVGKLPCELGQSVTLLRDAREPGTFNLFIKNHVYQMKPVVSATGALRLEDSDKGAVWIQLADKSMLMNSQLGQRMADLCQSPSQMQVAQAQKLAPPPHLLEPLPANGLAQK
ncbi:MAG: hypothetical protein QM527_07440 [Alphaproteobacteria bacterium]|nr:hypothetical protein [Alphaproteobacteria bacterium]